MVAFLKSEPITETSNLVLSNMWEIICSLPASVRSVVWTMDNKSTQHSNAVIDFFYYIVCDLRMFGDDFELIINYLHQGHSSNYADQWFSRIRKAINRYYAEINASTPLLNVNQLIAAMKNVPHLEIRETFAVFDWESKFSRTSDGINNNVIELSGIQQIASVKIVASKNKESNGVFTRPIATGPFTTVPFIPFRYPVCDDPPLLLNKSNFPQSKVASFTKALNELELRFGPENCGFLRAMISTGTWTNDPAKLNPEFPFINRLIRKQTTNQVVPIALPPTPEINFDNEFPDLRGGELLLSRIEGAFLDTSSNPPIVKYKCIWADGDKTNETWGNLYTQNGDELADAAQRFIDENPKYKLHYMRTTGIAPLYCTIFQ